MLSLHDMLRDQAGQFERQGDLASAEQLYRRCLDERPGDAAVLLRLGLVLHRGGRPAEGLPYLRAAALAKPIAADRLGVFATALAKQGRHREAAAVFRCCAALEPWRPDPYLALGNALQDQGDDDAAARAYRRVVALAPDLAEGHLQLATTVTRLGRPEAARQAWRRLITLAPHLAEPYAELGGLSLEEDTPGAVAACGRAIALAPDDARSACHLGMALHLLDRDAEAAAAHRRTLALAPAFARAYANLGVSLSRLNDGEGAVAACRRALQLDPTAEGDDAEVAIRHRNLAYTLLLTGRLADGFRENEWRWRVPNFPSPRRGFAQPQWDGSRFPGKTLLVHAEQGFGDAIHFARYLPQVAALGGAVVLECREPLVELFRGHPDLAGVVPQGAPLPAFDLHLPMLSLPLACGTTPAAIPAAIPYLAVPPARRAAWQGLLPADGTRRIGLGWAGSPQHGNDRRRSLPLTHFQTLRWPARTILFSLQKGPAEAQLAGWRGSLPIVPLGGAVGDFADLAAAIAAVDLVITVDSAPAHLAGALGKPVWTLLPFAPDWRWMLERTDSPWYPTMRLFRQPRPGDWAGVMQAVEAALAEAFAC